MKRSISLILLLSLILSLLISCTTKHTHEYSTEYSSDETHHWYACECGEASGKSEHFFNDGVVTLYPTTSREGIMTYTCSVCLFEKNEKIAKLDKDHSHIYDSVKFDKTSHWNECVCGEKSGITAHSFDEGVITRYPTSEEEGIKTFSCIGCDFTKEEKIDKLDYDHTHEFSTDASDELSHWKECVCGAKDGVEAHSLDAGNVTVPATDLEAGIKSYSCTVCGRNETEILPAEQENGLSFLQHQHYMIPKHLSATPLSIEAEIKLDPSFSGRAGAIFGNYYGIRQDWLFEIYDNGVPRFYYVDASGNIVDIKFNNVDVRTGEFVHIALTFDISRNLITFYMNGEAKQTAECKIDLAPDITRYQFVVGGDNRSNNGIYFKGEIRSIAAYSDVRTAAEIARAAERGTNLYADDLILAYLLNKDSHGTDIPDVSENGYDLPREWLDAHEPDIEYAYSFAVVGDTQWLSKYKPAKMEGIYDWILANKDDKKIAHVFGLGDITEDWNTAGKEAEWIQAQKFISKLNGVVPYSLIRGNHDESKYFNKYFATEEYMDQFGGYYMVDGDIRNSYKLVRIGTTDYMFLTLDFGASDEMLAWANEVVLAHPNHRVIVTTHGYMGFDGGHLCYDNVFSSGDINSGSDVDTAVGGNIRSYNNGKGIWEKFVSLHPNIAYVLCGHTSSEDVMVLKSEGVHGNTVVQMLIDPQWMDPQKDGVGMVCMLYFTEDGSEMAVEWICTDTGKYYKELNQFSMNVSEYFDAEPHSFYDSYNGDYHYKACDCGYTYGKEAHVFDGGTINSDGFIVYSCDCGYQRITSASDDPIAKALQEMLEKYYNGGVYYKDVAGAGTTYYGGNEFWTTDREDYKRTADYLTLYDLVMGRCDDLKLDLGWNCLDGVYSSANESTVKGVRMFLLSLLNGDTSACDATRVTIEENGYQVIIKLYEGDSVVTEATVGLYATFTLETVEGESLGEAYAKVDADALCRATTPKIDGYVSEYDTLILDARYDELELTVHYSTVAVWDGVSVSASLKGSGDKGDPFLIESGADLAYIAEVINSAAATAPNFSGKYFIFTNSIDLNGHNLNIGSYPGWATRKGLHGFVDGNHCTVRGLKNTQSLFGTIEAGYLKNLSVYGEVNCASGVETAGGIVAYVANGGAIENLTSYVDVNGVSTLGGVVGNAENNASEVTNCVNYGNVTGSSWNIGGIAGSGGHNMNGCVNYGNAHSSGSDNVGGIAGTTKNTGSINNCRNYGTMSGVYGRVGGIVGLLNKTITNCINYGDVNASWDSGGIVGCVKEEESASIIGCINYGNVTGNTGMGGIFGFNREAAGAIFITDCVNNGSVSGTWGVGGIAGNTKAEISGCVNNGYLSAKGELGGIVGKCYGKVTECTNKGEIVGGQAIIGGIVGNLHDTTYAEIIETTNYQEGTVTGPGCAEIIGKRD